MSYLGISVKEAINKINNDVDGWFLPAIQRPYVWGSRYENELYICKLFDSILKGYPIGGLIVWKTNEEVPFREFVKDYLPGEIPKIVDKGLHKKPDKGLVYDGQQRLQTLFCCLKYTFNERILIYDLLFDLNNSDEPDEVGFSFVPKNSTIEGNYIRMNELFSKLPNDDKTDFRESILLRNQQSTDKQKKQIERNLDVLWDVFVKKEIKSLAYFPVDTNNEKVVNEVFERLNTGGMALSLADLLFSKIKDDYYDFEENLQICSKRIYEITGKGYIFNAYNILQLIYLIVKRGVRIDPKKVKKHEIKDFKDAWDKLEKPLIAFFNDYLWGQFKINNSSIIPRNLALLPIMVYFYELYNKGFVFKNISSENLKRINQYFIKSQVNDWNLQTYADNFSRIIFENFSKPQSTFDFPLSEIEDYISIKKQRILELNEETFIGYTWFALKLLTPERVYQFEPDMGGRFNPEIDHIFPMRLLNRTPEYDQSVNIIWNMQPTKGEINGFKTNYHPKDFFTDKCFNKDSKKIIGSKYVSDYDFLFPKRDGKIDFTKGIWDKPVLFIKIRRAKMISFLKERYDISFVNYEESGLSEDE